MSMNRIDQYPGRGWVKSCRTQKNLGSHGYATRVILPFVAPTQLASELAPGNRSQLPGMRSLGY
jgi:hypothetical protein